jgi:MerR family transcriptional regulator, light-induced transcriptional regulator
MIVYGISDIEKLSGVKAHTIRIWEKRYGIIPHRRTDTNVRYYTDEDLKVILNIASLNSKGYKISKIAAMSADEIRQAVAATFEVDEIFEDQIDSLAMAMFEINEFKFLKILDHHIQVKGFELTMDEIIYPFLDKLSIMWIAGSIRGTHENFVTSIIKRKLFVEIESIRTMANKSTPRFLVYLPENEDHELSILFLVYLIKARGGLVFFLGSNIPFPEVLEASSLFCPDYIFTLFNDSFSDMPLEPYLTDLSKANPNTTIGVSGFQIINQKINFPTNFIKFDNLYQIIELLDDKLGKAQQSA